MNFGDSLQTQGKDQEGCGCNKFRINQ